ncbi:hypothetical protein DIPPA_29651 [Diplonema papillatum]|nr:hypothetical protein DIPPA_29635 [Diplonema papillatum]KAJ9460088.1 hypothetical protein DIPPA_29651 [Diplonema papillatum]
MRGIPPCYSSGSSPIFLASCEGHASVVELLLRKGGGRVVVDLQNAGGTTALGVASAKGHAAVCGLLCGRG